LVGPRIIPWAEEGFPVIISSNGLGGTPPAIKPHAYGAGQLSPSRTQAASGQFDQVNISQTNTRESQFCQALVSRLSGEIRTSNTTGTIAQVKQQVQSGTYLPDPANIAARLLLRGDSIEGI
jgi:anti-sigma28 factor (negative regulator of flagellin synthesis)